MFKLLNKWFVNAPALPDNNHWVDLLKTFPKTTAPHYELNYDKKHQTSMKDLLTAISQTDVIRFQESLDLGYQTKQTAQYYEYFNALIQPIETYHYSQHALHQMFQKCRSFIWPEKMRDGVKQIHDDLLPKLLTQAENLPDAQFKIFKANYQKLMHDYDEKTWTKQALLDNPDDLKKQYYDELMQKIFDTNLQFEKGLFKNAKLVNPLLNHIMQNLLKDVLPTQPKISTIASKIKACHTLESIIDWCLLFNQFNRYHEKSARIEYDEYLKLATNLTVDFKLVKQHIKNLNHYDGISYCMPYPNSIPVITVNQTHHGEPIGDIFNFIDPTYTIAYEQCQKLKLPNPFENWVHLMRLDDFKTALTNQDNHNLKINVDNNMVEIIKDLIKHHWKINQPYSQENQQDPCIGIGLNQIDDTLRYVEPSEIHRIIIFDDEEKNVRNWIHSYLLSIEKLMD